MLFNQFQIPGKNGQKYHTFIRGRFWVILASWWYLAKKTIFDLFNTCSKILFFKPCCTNWSKSLVTHARCQLLNPKNQHSQSVVNSFSINLALYVCFFSRYLREQRYTDSTSRTPHCSHEDLKKRAPTPTTCCWVSVARIGIFFGSLELIAKICLWFYCARSVVQLTVGSQASGL